MKNLIEQLRACTKMHPLNIDLDVLLEAADAIEELTYAAGLVAYDVTQRKELSQYCEDLYKMYRGCPNKGIIE